MTDGSVDSLNIMVLKMDVDALRKEMTENTAATKELVDAWKAASKFVSFVKLAATLVSALGAAWIVIVTAWHGWSLK